MTVGPCSRYLQPCLQSTAVRFWPKAEVAYGLYRTGTPYRTTGARHFFVSIGCVNRRRYRATHFRRNGAISRVLFRGLNWGVRMRDFACFCNSTFCDLTRFLCAAGEVLPPVAASRQRGVWGGAPGLAGNVPSPRWKVFTCSLNEKGGFTQGEPCCESPSHQTLNK